MGTQSGFTHHGEHVEPSDNNLISTGEKKASSSSRPEKGVEDSLQQYEATVRKLAQGRSSQAAIYEEVRQRGYTGTKKELFKYIRAVRETAKQGEGP